MKTKNELLCDILSMCVYISQHSKVDVFFDYSPHCNAYSVFYYPEGWTEKTAGDMVFLNCVTGMTYKHLEDTIAKLKAIATELGVL